MGRGLSIIRPCSTAFHVRTGPLFSAAILANRSRGIFDAGAQSELLYLELEHAAFDLREVEDITEHAEHGLA